MHPPPAFNPTGKGTLSSGTPSDLLSKAEFAQPVCTAVQIGLVNFLAKSAITPDAVIGHSSGEIAAAYAAGAMGKNDAILCAYHLGRATKGQTQNGTMAAVGLGRDSIHAMLVDGAVVACENSGSSITLSGDEDAVEKTLAAVRARDEATFIRRLPVDMAYHSHHMREIGQVYQEAMGHIASASTAKIPFYSSVTGRRLESKACLGAPYWRANLESPVLFHTAMRSMLEDFKHEASIIMEVGPHSALQAPLRQILRQHPGKAAPFYIPTLVRGRDTMTAMLGAAGRAWMQGCPIDFSFLTGQAPILTDLPNYPWDHSSEFWREGRLSVAWRQKENPHHELLGSRCLESTTLEPAWRNNILCSDIAWLGDHKVGNDIVLPCAAYIAMVGEGVKQETGSDAYMLRNMVIKAALVLQPTESVEVITTMRPLRLTDTANASWFEISITAFDGTRWIQHCVAQGKALEQEGMPRHSVKIAKHHRQLTQGFWYERMKHLGLNYGPHVQGLGQISAHTRENRATAAIENSAGPGARYAVHPTTLDFCLQLFTVAVTNGVARRLSTLAIPSAIGSICIRPCGPRLIAEASAEASSRGVIKGNVVATNEENEFAILIENGVFNPLENEDSAEASELAAAARLEWRPDIDFIDACQLMRRASVKRESKLLIERVSALCILQVLEALENTRVPPGYLEKYVAWLHREREGMLNGQWSSTTPEALEWATLPLDQRDALVASLSQKLDEGGDIDAIAFAQMARRLSKSDNIQKIFRKEINPVQLLIEGNGLTHMYNFYNGMINSDAFFSLCAHARPSLRVLEVGAGTGGTTKEVLDAIIAKEGTRMYSQYTFTNISSGFFTAAKERFREFSGIDYRVLDISKDPAEQGFELGSYDLIVASNVLHATPSLCGTLRNVRSLLRSGGRLFLQELSQRKRGVLPGWWAGESDDRATEPIVCIERWDRELRQAGFSGVDASYLDDDIPFPVNANIISIAVDPPEPATHQQQLTFLYSHEKHDFACSLANRLTDAGISVHWNRIGYDEPVPDRDVVATMDVEKPYLHDISPTEYEGFIRYLSNLRSGVLWLTRPAQVRCTDPRYGLTTGFARTVRSELSLDFSTVELQHLDSAAVCSATKILNKFQCRSTSTEYNVEADPKDILGLEASGVVTRVGSAVNHLRPGDRIRTMQAGAFATRNVVSSQLVVRIPDSLSFEEAATMPAVYATVIYCVVNLGRLERGQSILIQSACGGVGLAALQVCKMLGADHANSRITRVNIYVTVGNEQKVQYLMETHGIPRTRIFHSRNTSFLNDVMQATNGRGVDMVLNSLSGELLHASWQCVARFGKMMDIGKRDFIGRGQLMLNPFQNNRTFYGIDLAEFRDDRPCEIRRLMEQCVEYYEAGHISPIRPQQVFQASQVADTFRCTQKGLHMGKIVISMPEDGSLSLPTAKPQRESTFSHKGSYLLVGGLGGLGKALATWMVEQGARHFVFLSRSAGSSVEDQAFIRGLESQGCRVVAVAGSVTELSDVRRAVKAAHTPIVGAIQMSMVLRDLPLTNIGFDDWNAVLGPKVRGTWNLHEALRETKLDFFILFSSLSAVFGQPGQANYAAANSFLESFTQYRHSQKLPCSMVGVGFMEGIGYVSQNAADLNQAHSLSIYTLQEQDLYDAIQICIQQSSPFTAKDVQNEYCNTGQLTIGLRSSKPLSDPTNRTVWKRDLRMALYRQLESTFEETAGQSSDGRLRNLLTSAASSPDTLNEPGSLSIITSEIGRTICGFIMMPEEDLDATQNLGQMGVDSLVCIEIRNWWRRTLGVEITVLEIMRVGTVERLGETALTLLQAKFGAKADPKVLHDAYLAMKAP
ncbi:hypothetical protein HIM_05191 [Hirsutella minnesotensis 3608]|uniref:Uncharacterized protein n=1 Tax=Hirsutella minnesotensis 3608 TaxID=1043627 RepID=A0A0F7ZPH2_9HYPO|nr:hypothetical protein HIM_05191 [Hirsutella minnesotensis 3608]